MKITETRKKLIELLYGACVEYIDTISEKWINEQIYAFTLHCDSGLEVILGAAVTHESLAKLQEKFSDPEYEDYSSFNDVNIAEWERLDVAQEPFAIAYDFILDIHRNFEDGEFDDVDFDSLEGDEYQKFVNEFFIDVVVKIFTQLKESGSFNKVNFDKDLLLGVVINDPTDNDLYIIEKVSEQVNSEYWHAKVKAYCEHLKSLSA
jgi:hypothetical protein